MKWKEAGKSCPLTLEYLEKFSDSVFKNLYSKFSKLAAVHRRDEVSFSAVKFDYLFLASL